MVLDEAGILRSCRVFGHAGFAEKGSDIVCAAVSVLTRTMIKVLSGREDITIRGCIPGAGNFQMEADYSGEGREYLAATGAFLIEGLISVAEEFPDNCKVNIERRKYNGT